MDEQSLIGLDNSELKEICKLNNFPSYHGDQLYSWLYKQSITDIEKMTNVPNELKLMIQKKFKQNNLQIKSVYTSLLNRATETTDIVTEIINFPKEEIKYDWRLNERHYGALQGLNKSETASKYGEDQVQIWRRSYDISPPLLSDNDKRHPKFNEKFTIDTAKNTRNSEKIFRS